MMKKIFAIGLLILLPNMALSDDLFAGTVEQKAEFIPRQMPNSVISVLLVNDNDNYKLIILKSPSKITTKASTPTKLMELPNFWKGGVAYNSREDIPAAIELAAIDNGFEVKVTDRSIDAQNQEVKFEYKDGRFQLTGEKMMASPRIVVKTDNSEVIQGRWKCMIINDYVDDSVVEQSPRGLKHFRKVFKPVYLDDYKIQTNYVNILCK